MTQAKLRTPAPIRIVFDGQSLNNVPAYPMNMPHYVMANRFIPWVDVAISGMGWLDLTPTVATRLYPYARNRPGCVDILMLEGGQGDILNSGTGYESDHVDGATTYTRAVTYANNARTAGFDYVLISNITPIGPNVLGTGRPTTSEESAIEDYQALILANSGGFDAVIDINQPPLNDATNGTYFYVDRTHWVEEGARAAAAIISPVLDAFLGSL